MNGKWFFLPILVLYLVVSFSDLCAGKNPKNNFTVKRIVFTSDKIGGEWISIFCSQSFTPELSFLEGENPRVVMDIKGVSLIQTKARTLNTGGRLVKKVRNYLDKQTKILRVVLDLEPSKSYIIRPRQDPPENAYLLLIYEDTSLSEQKPGGRGEDKSSSLSQEKRIMILDPDMRAEQEQQERKAQEIVTGPGKLDVAKNTKAPQSVSQGRSQMNGGDFAASVETFTQVIAAHPQDSLSYRLRGNYYDNLGDQQKALEDWTQAARLGDTIIQSYLDALEVKWQETPPK